MKKEEMDKLVAETFREHKNAKRAFVTSDGTVFLDGQKNNAHGHQAHLNGPTGTNKVEEFVNPKFQDEIKESEELEAKEASIDEKYKRLTDKEGTLNEKAQELDDKEATLEALESKLADDKADLAEDKAEFEKAKAELGTLEELNQKVSDLEAEKATLETEKETLAGANTDLLNDLEKANTEAQEKATEIDSLGTALTEKDKEIAALKKAVKNK
ncbi:MAG: hypothetical protein ABJG41_10025 [Cyclobacteriaceae bacterium]